MLGDSDMTLTRLMTLACYDVNSFAHLLCCMSFLQERHLGGGELGVCGPQELRFFKRNTLNINFAYIFCSYITDTMSYIDNNDII